jgi:hypothetical protein
MELIVGREVGRVAISNCELVLHPFQMVFPVIRELLLEFTAYIRNSVTVKVLLRLSLSENSLDRHLAEPVGT